MTKALEVEAAALALARLDYAERDEEALLWFYDAEWYRARARVLLDAVRPHLDEVEQLRTARYKEFALRTICADWIPKYDQDRWAYAQRDSSDFAREHCATKVLSVLDHPNFDIQEGGGS